MSGRSEPQTIDLAYAGENGNGVPLYAPPVDALISYATRGLVWLLTTYPREMLYGLALVGVGFLGASIVSPPARKPARKNAALGTGMINRKAPAGSLASPQSGRQ